MQIGLNPLDSCLFSLKSPSIFRQSFGDKDEATPRIQPAPIHPRRCSAGCTLSCLNSLSASARFRYRILLKLNTGAALKVCRVEIIRQPVSKTQQGFLSLPERSLYADQRHRPPNDEFAFCQREFHQIFPQELLLTLLETIEKEFEKSSVGNKFQT